MLAVRPFVRLVAVFLLAFAAMDLSSPASCEDEGVVGSAQTQICAGDHATAASHDCDACFCCSHTVRAEWRSTFAAFDGLRLQSMDTETSLVFAPAVPPYRPPLI
jgi:hypothetical protein